MDLPELDGLFTDDVDVVSAQQFAEFVGLTYDSMRLFCVEYDVPKLGNSFAITRDRAEQLLEAVDESLAAAEGGDDDEDDEDEAEEEDADEGD